MPLCCLQRGEVKLGGNSTAYSANAWFPFSSFCNCVFWSCLVPRLLRHRGPGYWDPRSFRALGEHNLCCVLWRSGGLAAKSYWRWNAEVFSGEWWQESQLDIACSTSLILWNSWCWKINMKGYLGSGAAAAAAVSKRRAIVWLLSLVVHQYSLFPVGIGRNMLKKGMPKS